MVHVKKFQEEQRKLARKVFAKDAYDKLELLAGIEQGFTAKKIISGIVVCDYNTMKIKEKAHTVMDSDMPYLSGYRAFREGPVIAEVWNKLEVKPDVLLFQGSGQMHPLRVGLASHMGVVLDQPTIGVSKEPWCGEVEDGFVLVNNKKVAQVLKTKSHAKPLYISAGHRISLNTSVKIVKASIREPHKLPEPLHLAHRYVKKLRSELKG